MVQFLQELECMFLYVFICVTLLSFDHVGGTNLIKTTMLLLFLMHQKAHVFICTTLFILIMMVLMRKDYFLSCIIKHHKAKGNEDGQLKSLP